MNSPLARFVRPPRQRASLGHWRQISSSHNYHSSRAVVYASNGPPGQVLSILSIPPLPPPKSKTLNIRYLLAPINPSDINLVEGAYPAKPAPRTNFGTSGFGSKEKPAFIPGNEGLAEVESVGDGVEGYNKGDWVVMVKPQAGTWSTEANVEQEDVIRIPEAGGSLSEVQCATMTVNPPTAYNMLSDFVDLKSGDWVVQNGANSAVGQAVIQIAHDRGLKTLNFVRDRPDFTSLEGQLKSLGASEVLTIESLSDKAARSRVRELTGGAPIRLALNCVSGPTTAAMAGLLGSDAHLVSYGAMSKQPVTLPTGAFIFKGLTAHGFWQSRWYKENGMEQREELMREIVQLMVQGKLKEPPHELLEIAPDFDDEAATGKLRTALNKLLEGRSGSKLLLKFV